MTTQHTAPRAHVGDPVKREADDRAAAREHVLQQARKGQWPINVFRQTDLQRIYEGVEHELQEAVDVARAVHAARAEQERAREQAAELRRETRAVLREWDKQAEAERTARAEAEARRRLGLEESK